MDSPLCVVQLDADLFSICRSGVVQFVVQQIRSKSKEVEVGVYSTHVAIDNLRISDLYLSQTSWTGARSDEVSLRHSGHLAVTRTPSGPVSPVTEVSRVECLHQFVVTRPVIITRHTASRVIDHRPASRRRHVFAVSLKLINSARFAGV